MVNFGAKLKELRIQSGMTQADLADRLGVTKSVVSYYELQERNPSPDTIIRLTEVFHVTADYLLDIDHKKVIDVSDLTNDDVRLLLTIIDAFRKKNSAK